MIEEGESANDATAERPDNNKLSVLVKQVSYDYEIFKIKDCSMLIVVILLLDIERDHG